MGKIHYNITGLQEFVLTFEDYCVPCPYHRNCKFGKDKPFQLTVDCKDITNALEYRKGKEMEKLAKKNPDMDWDTREKKAKVTRQQIYSELWNDKVKAKKDELGIYCLDSKRLDSMITSQRSEEWWADFREVMKKIDEECSKIV
jgi:hypothetical protein